MKSLSRINAGLLGLLVLLYLYGFLGFLVVMPIVLLNAGVGGQCDGEPRIPMWMVVRCGRGVEGGMGCFLERCWPCCGPD